MFEVGKFYIYDLQGDAVIVQITAENDRYSFDTWIILTIENELVMILDSKSYVDVRSYEKYNLLDNKSVIKKLFGDFNV